MQLCRLPFLWQVIRQMNLLKITKPTQLTALMLLFQKKKIMGQMSLRKETKVFLFLLSQK